MPFFSRYRVWLLSIVALGFGLLGITGAHGFITGQIDAERARLQRQHQLVPIVVVRQDTPAGTFLTEPMLATREVPVRYASASSVGEDDYETVLGKVLQVSVKAGEPVLTSTLGLPADGFSGQVRHGIRAMTIEVDEVNSVSGMLRPGDRIDLLFSTRSPIAGANGSDISRPLMQDLKVLATGSQTGNPVSPAFGGVPEFQGFTSMTVEVSPEQAQKLVLAQRSGRLTALLRNPDDRHPIASDAMDVFSLLGMPKPTKRIRKRQQKVELIVGGQGRVTRSRIRAR